MPWYRIYYLDSLGHVEKTKEISSSNDAEAIAAFDSEGCHAELWQRDRFLRSADALIQPTPSRDGPPVPAAAVGSADGQ